MRIRLLAATAIAAVIAAIASLPASPAAQAKTTICGQIKHGPHATYTFRLTNKKLSGNTWTIFSTGVPCSAAMKAAPAILKWWTKAKVDASDYSAKGFGCNKESDDHGSSGTIGCIYAKGKSGTPTIELIMTGSYTVAQLKRLFFIG